MYCPDSGELQPYDNCINNPWNYAGFNSTKFMRKLKYVRSLRDLSDNVPTEYIYVPDDVQKYVWFIWIIY